jgi:DNA-binding MarR family transcriptional regulator
MPSVEDIVKAMSDAVGRIVEQWREQRPDLDAGPMLVVGRLQRLSQLMDAVLRPTFAEAGLAQGDFDILAALRRAGPPYSRTAGELLATLMVTSGAVTKQVDRLAAKGLVSREIGEDDARVRRITLTASGVSLVDELIVVHLERERQLLASLTPDQLAQLAATLEVLAEDLESGGT